VQDSALNKYFHRRKRNHQNQRKKLQKLRRGWIDQLIDMKVCLTYPICIINQKQREETWAFQIIFTL
jgi:hypothetical protein